MTICKTAEGNCPRNLVICCGECEYRNGCAERCPTNTMEGCHNKEVVGDELEVFTASVPDVIASMTNLLQLKKDLEEQEKVMKQKLLEAMETYGVKAFENDQIKLTYVAPTTRTAIDTARLKKDHPQIAADYSKTSEVSASVRITVK